MLKLTRLELLGLWQPDAMGLVEVRQCKYPNESLDA